jgi:hypothetical protein
MVFQGEGGDDGRGFRKCISIKHKTPGRSKMNTCRSLASLDSLPLPHGWVGLGLPAFEQKSAIASQIGLNCPMRGVPFRRANHAELKSKSPLGLNYAASRGASWSKAGILVRLRSLGETILTRKILHLGTGKTPVFSLVAHFALDIAPEVRKGGVG